MALLKNRLYNGAEVNYWKISGMNITWTGNIAQVFIIGFLSETDRELGIDKKIVFENYIVKGIDFDTYFGVNTLDINNPLKCAYNYLKEKVDIFIDSVDV